MTPLEEGIFVVIPAYEKIKLDSLKGYLSRSAYPEEYEKIAAHNEIGRFNRFRILDE